MTEDMPARPAPPAMVAKARDLAHAFQSGSDEAMLDIMRPAGIGNITSGGLVGELMSALAQADDRTLTYAAPQLAALAERVGWLRHAR